MQMRDEMIDIPVRIVLVGTTHPGNIGASARAMKTMRLSDLVLVGPAIFPSAEATARASGADDVLARARVVETLADGIAECAFVVAASARLRSLQWPMLDPRSCASALCEHALDGPVAVVFGPEHSGLSNEDLARCHALVTIPANPEYSSLNLAMAVQVICYELMMARIAAGILPSAMQGNGRDAPLATSSELEGLHRHLEQVMSRAGFLNPDHSRLLRQRLRRLFNRAQLDQTELNILRGFLAAVDPQKRTRTPE